MLLRPFNRIFPRHVSDIACFLLMAIFVPLGYIVEMSWVLPEMHEVGSFYYNFTWFAGLFLLFNLIGNFLACMMVETSIKNELLKPPTEPELRRLWRLCNDCQVLAPPRSWHCQWCNTCILKRDHHCKFTGCCIGHHNYRFFFYFLVYLCIGSAYALAYNSFYIWYLHGDYYATPYTALKMVFPMMFFFIDWSWPNFLLLLYELCIIAFLMCASLIVFHAPIVASGALSHEHGTAKYDLGFKRNLEMLLGKRMYLTWLSPFIKSDLPHNGVDWEPIKHR